MNHETDDRSTDVYPADHPLRVPVGQLRHMGFLPLLVPVEPVCDEDTLAQALVRHRGDVVESLILRHHGTSAVVRGRVVNLRSRPLDIIGQILDYEELDPEDAVWRMVQLAQQPVPASRPNRPRR